MCRSFVCSVDKAKKQVMARTTRQRRKMANTTDAPTSASSLLSSTTSTTFDGASASVTYPSEGYNFNYSGLVNLGGYSLDDLNYTELWVDVWNGTEASNVTERLNATVLPSGGYCDEWESAQHKLFQVIFSVKKKDFSTQRFLVELCMIAPKL